MKKEIPGSEWLFLSKEEAVRKATDVAGLQLDKLPQPVVTAEMKARLVDAHKVLNGNVVSLMNDQWAVSYEFGREVPELKARVIPQVVVSYTGLRDSVSQTAQKAVQAGSDALPTQPQDIVSCVKGAETRRLWVSKGEGSDTLRCLMGSQQGDAVASAWFAYAQNDANFCQQKMAVEANKLMGQGFSCAGR